MSWLSGIFSRGKSGGYVTVVSGLPRSGTSMMMKMLDSGGIPPMIDNLRTPDADNPKGYYEFERVKKLPEGDSAWVKDARGRAVKVISALLEHLPGGYEYRIVFMQREMGEILASQRKMLARNNEDPDRIDDARMAELYTKHLAQVDELIAARGEMRCLKVSYNQMLSEPRPQLEALHRFFDSSLNLEAMATAVDAQLYRQRNR